MAAEDELALPQVPEVKSDDAEDVSWALSTAEAMWARGDHLEGIKWLRKAAEAASDVEQDERALELAKAASDLATILARRSLASPTETVAVTETRTEPREDASEPTAVSALPSRNPSVPPPRPAALMARSAPPVPAAPKPPQPPPTPPRRAPTLDARTAPRSPRNGIAPKAQGFAEEARTAGAARSQKDRTHADPDTTVVAKRGDVESSAERWDASPTENLTGEAMDRMSADGDRTTAFALVSAKAPPAPVPRAPLPTLHDPAIQTTQAVRVVVWRDVNGVHVAPAGTRVSALSIDAVLVVLEEGADLTAWLSQREP
jgi:hypothetical protein